MILNEYVFHTSIGCLNELDQCSLYRVQITSFETCFRCF